MHVIADAQVRPQSPDPPAAVPIGGRVEVVALVYAVLTPFPDLLGVVHRREAHALRIGDLSLQRPIVIAHHDLGAGIIRRGPGIGPGPFHSPLRRGHDPGIAGDIEVTAVHIVAVDGIVAGLVIGVVVVDLVDPVLHIQRQIQLSVRHIPVVNGLLHGVVIAEEIAAVIDGVVAEDVVAAVIVPQGHHYMTII